MKLLRFTAEASLYQGSNYYNRDIRANEAKKPTVSMQQIYQPDFSWTRPYPQFCASIERVCTEPQRECVRYSEPYCITNPITMIDRCFPGGVCLEERIMPPECHWECRSPANLANPDFRFF